MRALTLAALGLAHASQGSRPAPLGIEWIESTVPNSESPTPGTERTGATAKAARGISGLAAEPGGEPAFIGQNLVAEVEPNDSAATATPLGADAVGIGNLPPPGGDVDFWSFTASAGDRVYAATQTSFSANASTASLLDLIASDGVTVLESDVADGSFGPLSSSIAGALIPSSGTYYLRVRHPTTATGQLRPYHLHVRVQSGTPTPESEPNDTRATANPLPVGGWVRGARNPGAATEQDWFRIALNAGDTVFVSLDLDPERDNLPGAGGWNGRVAFGLFGDGGNQLLTADDSSAGSTANPLSEALFMTVKVTGTYYVVVDAAVGFVGGPTHTYHLSVSVRPATAIGVNCTTYPSTDGGREIPTGAGPIVVDSSITVPGNPRIADLDVTVTLSHGLMADLDVTLISPRGNEGGLFTDIDAGPHVSLDIVYDDQAGIPPLFAVQRSMQHQPEPAYRLNWFNGMNGGGTWTLRIRDDQPSVGDGALQGWSLRICEEPPDPPCPPGRTPVVVYQSDFEADGGGFTVSGPSPAPWQHGTPTASVINTCQSGTKCWKTNLTGNYSANANQDLLSPPINLQAGGLSGPVRLELWRKYHVEAAQFDRFFAEIREVGGANPRRLFEFLDATMSDSVGSPPTTVHYAAGWGRFAADITPYLGSTVELLINFVSNNTVQLNGIAIDDVRVTACSGCGGDPDCDDGNACTSDACEAGACVHAHNTEPCDDGNPCTAGDVCGDGSCSGTPVPALGEVQTLGIAADKVTVAWAPTPGATSYGVVRGDLGALPVGPGGGDETCFTVMGSTSLVDAATPPAGGGLWYVVRAHSPCGNGPYGSASNGSPRITTTCP